MNHVLHVAAIVQIRHDTEGRAYYRRKLAAGKTPMEALRCLKRRLSDVVYRQLISRRPTGRRCGPGRALRGDSRIQRGRLTPAHRHFGSATSRTRSHDATPLNRSHERPRRDAFDTEGCQMRTLDPAYAQASVTGSSVHATWPESRPEATAASAHASSGAKV